MKTVDYRAAVRRAVLRQLRAVCRHCAQALKNDDIEGVHQSRVACRRLFIALSVFKSAFKKRAIKRWKRRFRGLTKELGRARDLDIQIAYLNAYAASRVAAPVRRGLRKIISGFERHRMREQKRVREAVIRFERTSAVSDIRDQLDALPASFSEYPRGRFYKKSHAAVLKRVQELRSLRKHAASPDDIDGLHAMRIAAKWLRFTLEYYQPFYAYRMKSALYCARMIQKHLGAVHDADVCLHDLFPAMRRQAENDREAIAAIAWLENDARVRRAKEYEKFYVFWKKCEQKKIFQQLTAMTQAYEREHLS